MRWFPDKKGLITGISITGHVFGAFLWTKLAGSWGQLIASQGLNKTFIIYGIVFMIFVFTGCIWMKYPPEGWKPAGWTPAKGKDRAKLTDEVNFPSGEMLKTLQYYLILFTFVLGTSASLMSIKLM